MRLVVRTYLGSIIIGGGLVGSVGHHIVFAPVFTDTLVDLTASFLPPVLAVATGLALVVFVHSTEIENADLGRAAGWYLTGALLFGIALSASYQQNIDGMSLSAATWFSVANWTISGSVVGLLVASYDIRRRRALDRARRNEQRATNLSQRLSVLNRVLRHDVRNQTTIIQGYTQQLDAPSTDSDAVVAIEEAAGSLTAIADRVGHIERIIEETHPESIDLTGSVTDHVRQLREQYPDAAITMDVPPKARAWTFPAIHLALGGLLSNAIEHNPQPESACRVAITVKRLPSQSEEVLEVVIEDNGPGIPEPERVVMTGGEETQLTHSRGTSLWLTRWVIDESGGDFSIEATDSEGTRIRLRLPAAED